MDFNLSSEQIAIQKLVKEFNTREIEPIAAQLERSARLPDTMLKKFAGLGLLGMTVPKKYGGGQTSNLNCILAIEQLACSGTGVWWLTGFHNSIPESINAFGSEAIKQKYLRPLCAGEAYASIQFTEEETGSDPRMLITTAKATENGYVINGNKRFSTFGARDGYGVTYTRDEDGSCTAFIVEKNTEGYTTSNPWELMGSGGVEAVDVYYENFVVPKENLLGKKGEGFKILLHWIAAEKIEQCAAATGIAQAALDESIKYTSSRKSRGKPVSAMQGIRWMLADMKVKLDACRLMTYRAAFLQDQQAPDWQTEAASAKLFVVPAALEIVETAKRLHGGYGYTRELKIERLYRSIAGFPAVAVSLEINKSIVGSALLEKKG
jgi:alkylation response protein AidB-like acyl-CoA dehydrogenase